jgi:alcohol dehydrogenase class IV
MGPPEKDIQGARRYHVSVWFHYENPPRIYAGAGCVVRLVDEAREAHRLFLITNRSAQGAIGAGLSRLLGGRLAGSAIVRQHAPVGDVRAAAAAARAARPDALVSLGGGSAVDTAKCVAALLAGGDLQSSVECDTLPHLAVPTTLSAAEMDGAAGFTDGGEKRGIASPSLTPRAVFYDPELTLSTPLDLWLSTGIRAVDHAVEGLIAPEANPLSQAAALEALRKLSRALARTKSDPSDLAAREEAQMGAWLSMLLPMASARGLSHTLGKRIGARHGIPHGVTSCLLLPHVVRDHLREHRGILSQVSEALGRSGADPAEALQALIADLGLPQHLGAYHLAEDDLVAAAAPVARRLERPVEELVAIYRAAW